jgi:hypothetical protein
MDVGLVVEMNSNLSLVTYDSATHRTFGLCLLRFEGNAQRLMRRIERLPNFAISPLFAPVVIAGIAVHDMRTYSNTIIVESFTMESALGYWSRESDDRVERDSNLAKTIQSLNALSIRIADIEFILSKTTSALDFLNEQLLVWPEEPGVPIRIELQEQTRWLRQFTLNWMGMIKRTQYNVQSMTQTVCSWTKKPNTGYI